MNCHMPTNNTDIQIERINRLKVVLVEQNRTGKWLAEQLGKNEEQFPAGVLMRLNHHLKCLLKLQIFLMLTLVC